MTDRFRVLLVFPLPDPSVEAELAEQVEIVRPSGLDEDALIEAVPGVHALVTRGVGTSITARVLNAADALRVVCAVGSGTDNIDVAAAELLGIPVIHGAGVAPRPVSEYVIAGMVIGHRRLLELHATVGSGGIEDWVGRVERFRGTELTGRTLGLVGLGNIGREVARMAHAAFGSEVLAYDPFVRREDVPPNVELVSALGDLLDRSLTVSVHVPLLPTTTGLLGRPELRRIGANGVLIDAARGGVVDEEALIEVLTLGELKAAVLDVYAGEPPTSAQAARLAAVPNLLLTPHVAGVTDQSLRGLARAAVDGVLGVLHGSAPERRVRSQP